MTSEETNHVTEVPTVNVQSRTGTLDLNEHIGSDTLDTTVNDLIDSNSPVEADPFDTVYDPQCDGSRVPTTDQAESEETPALADVGKGLLAGYADWRETDADYDPEDAPLRYLWYDAPEIIIAALIVGYVGYKGLQRLDGLPAGTADESAPQPQEALEDRPYRVFVSHSWKYADHHERITEFLEDEDRLDWQDFSVPEDDPLDVADANDLRQQLYHQISQANVVIVLAGMYVPHSTWIEEEIAMATSLDKPIIGVKPHGNERLPKVVREEADELIGWQQRSLVNAIAKHG